MPLLLPPLLLSACGGKDVPPEQYSSNDTALPALTSTLSSENIQFSHKEGSEDQPDSYVYSGLSSMTDTLASYVQALEEDGCSPIDTNGVVKELPDFSVSSGSVSIPAMAVYFSSKLPGRGTPVPSPPSMRPSCALPSPVCRLSPSPRLSSV